MQSFLLHKYSKESLFYIKKIIKEGFDPSIIKTAYYTTEQIKEIYYGLKANVDISIYSSNSLSSEQMRYIREGLMKGLDVSLYANKKFSAGQMKAIKESLIYGTYIDEYQDFHISEEMMNVCNVMLLEGYDKEFVKSLAKNRTSGNAAKTIRRINEIIGDRYNYLFAKYKLTDNNAKAIANIILQAPDICDDKLFKIYTHEKAKRTDHMSAITKAIENGAPLTLCEEFLNSQITINELIKQSQKYLEENEDILKNYEINEASKELGIDIKEEYPDEIICKSISLNLDFAKLIKEGYDYEQLEEINCAFEDNIKNFLDLVNPKTSSNEMFLIRNNTLIDRCLKNLKNKYKKKHKDFFTFFDISYQKGYWYIKDKSNKIFFKNNDIDIILEKIKYLYELLTKELTTEEILLIIEESKE